ncbi:MAG: DUF1287 domain-containing protein [Planctomycetes bacterium]|nr:DUF1287 domain-containing protein [Planctomycetota bacterium]
MPVKVILTLIIFCTIGCGDSDKIIIDAEKPPEESKVFSKQDHPLVSAAREQIGVTTSYDPAYVGLKYPNGDVPMDRGVCSDVVVRALRVAYNQDLQELIHLDMKKNFRSYPKKWGLKRTDRNIDHRRVLNIRTYLKRQGYSLSIPGIYSAYQAGDIVTCKVGNLDHIAIISSKRNRENLPYIIHNIGSGAKEDDYLQKLKITARFTYPKQEFNKSMLPTPEGAAN